MRFDRILSHYADTPWVITLPMLEQLCGIVNHQMAEGVKIAESFMDIPIPPGPQIVMNGAVAIIPIEGVIDKKIAELDRISGAVDVDEISQLLILAAEDETVDSIILRIDSPGGTVTGVPELAATVRIANAMKPVIAYTDTMMASAAYWIGAGAGWIMAAESAQVGSIGTYIAFVDRSAEFNQLGLKVELIKAGDLKGTGYPGTALSDEQRDNLQQSVDHINGMFQSFVSEQRADVSSNEMRGQSFFANQSVGVLVDEIGSFADAVDLAARIGAQFNAARKD